MSTDASQLLRLEIERPPDAGELLNLAPNPSGDLGAWGWSTPVAGSFLRSSRLGGRTVLVYTSPGAVPSHFATEPMPIAAGQYAAARWVAPAVTGLHAASIEWLDTTKAVIGTTAAGAKVGASADARAYGSYVAPSGAAYFRLRFDHYDGSGGNPTAGSTMFLRDVVATAAATPGDLAVTRTNLLPTPSAEGGRGNWTAEGGATVGTSAAQSWDGTHSFTITKKDAKGPAALRSPSMTVQPGRDYALQVRSRSGSTERTVTVSARWLDAAGKVLATVPVKTQVEVNAMWTVPLSGVATAPTNAATLRLMVQYGYMAENETHYVDACMVEQSIRVDGYFDGNAADAFGWTYEWAGTPYASASVASGPTGDPGVLVPVAYQNILGPTGQISIDREDLNVGSMSVRLFDAILDPTQTDLVRPGKRIRLLAVDPDDGSTEVIFAGKTFTASVKYHLLERDEHKRAEVTLTAVDPINSLAATPQREGVATIDELPHVLEGAGVPWSVNGSGNQVASAVVVAYNDNASALDQVAVTRDSALGYAWVDRNGVLQAWDRDLLDATVAADLVETTYNADIDIDFDLDRIVNSVTVKVLRVIATSGVTEEVSFGPYVDQASYAQWGEHSAEYVVQGFDAADAAAIQAYAERILAANATPHQRVNSLVLPVQSADDLAKARLDLYDLVHVVNGRANVDEDSRIISLHHEITATNSGTKWLVTVGFVKDGSVASSTAVPSPPPGVGAVKEETDAALTELNLDLAELNTVTLPGVQADLAALNADLATLDGLFPITSTNISDGAITTPKMIANSISGDRITTNTLNASKIVANSITGDRIQGNTIGADKIVANSIGADRLAANAITADKIDANAITGKNIVSSTGSQRVEISSVAAGKVVFYSSSQVGYVGPAAGGLLLSGPGPAFAVVDGGGINLFGGRFDGDLAGDTNCSGVLHAFRLETDITTTGNPANTHMDVNGRLFQSTSSRRYKYDIEDAGLDPTVALQMRPTVHRRTDDPGYDEADPSTGPLYLAPIAEEVAELSEWLVIRDAEGRPDGINWQAVALHTLATLKDLSNRVETLEQA